MSGFNSRVAFAAAHVVADPHDNNSLGQPATLDWDATLAFRHHLWDLGFGVADAMDTAQRGMGLDWTACSELIMRSGKEAQTRGARLACGVNTDQHAEQPTSLDAVVADYLEQLETVEGAGATPIVMASRALATIARTEDDYHDVYGRVLSQSAQPVILHWLGTAFDPQLEGYWGSSDLDAAADSVVNLITENAGRVDGIKVSLLDAGREVGLRRRLPAGVRMYTGDDFNYPELIRGDDVGYSHALLGVFDPIAPIAAQALAALGDGDGERFSAILEPTLPLARHLFAAPTYHYKTGIVFLAWLCGHQSHFTMVNGAQAGRSAPHLVELAHLAADVELFPDGDLAARRLQSFQEVTGSRDRLRESNAMASVSRKRSPSAVTGVDGE